MVLCGAILGPFLDSYQAEKAKAMLVSDFTISIARVNGLLSEAISEESFSCNACLEEVNNAYFLYSTKLILGFIDRCKLLGSLPSSTFRGMVNAETTEKKAINVIILNSFENFMILIFISYHVISLSKH